MGAGQRTSEGFVEALTGSKIAGSSTGIGVVSATPVRTASGADWIEHLHALLSDFLSLEGAFLQHDFAGF